MTPENSRCFGAARNFIFTDLFRVRGIAVRRRLPSCGVRAFSDAAFVNGLRGKGGSISHCPQGARTPSVLPRGKRSSSSSGRLRTAASGGRRPRTRTSPTIHRPLALSFKVFLSSTFSFKGFAPLSRESGNACQYLAFPSDEGAFFFFLLGRRRGTLKKRGCFFGGFTLDSHSHGKHQGWGSMGRPDLAAGGTTPRRLVFPFFSFFPFSSAAACFLSTGRKDGRKGPRPAVRLSHGAGNRRGAFFVPLTPTTVVVTALCCSRFWPRAKPYLPRRTPGGCGARSSRRRGRWSFLRVTSCRLNQRSRSLESQRLRIASSSSSVKVGSLRRA